MVQKVWSVTRPFGDRIRQRLVTRNLSIRAWAEALDMTPSYCYQILNGHQHLNVERIIQTARCQRRPKMSHFRRLNLSHLRRLNLSHSVKTDCRHHFNAPLRLDVDSEVFPAVGS